MADVAAPTAQPVVEPRTLAAAPQLEAKAPRPANRQVIDAGRLQGSMIRTADTDVSTPARAAARPTGQFKPQAGALRSRDGQAALAGDIAVAAPTGSRTGGVSEAPAAVAAGGSLQNNSRATYQAPSAALAPAGSGGGQAGGKGVVDVSGPSGTGGAGSGGRKTILDYGTGGGGRGGGGGLNGRARLAEPEPTAEIVAKASDEPAPKQAVAEVKLEGNGIGMTLSGQIQGRKILTSVMPDYTAKARKNGWEGVVAVHFTVLARRPRQGQHVPGAVVGPPRSQPDGARGHQAVPLRAPARRPGRRRAVGRDHHRVPPELGPLEKIMKNDRMTLSLTILLLAAAMPAAAQDQATDQPPEQAPEQGQEWTKDGESGAALPEMVVEAQNEVRQEIEKGTFSFALDAAAVDSFFTAMDVEALGVSPVSGLQPHLNNLETLASDQPPHLWIADMARTPVATFFTAEPEGHKVKSWALTVTDFRGSPFRTYTGSGRPPRQLDWDGKGDNGEMLKVGYPYSYVFTLTDKGTNTYNHAGISFRIPALDYPREGDRVLEIAGGELFVREESTVADGGQDWLVRATDEIRQHPWSPVRVIVTAERRDLAEQRADRVGDFLAEALILPREQVETEAVQKPDLRAEMDGSVAIVIEHVEH